MIVLVLFTVIAGRGKHVVRDVRVTVLAPILQQSVGEPTRRRLVLCQQGRASVLDLDDVIEEAVSICEQHSSLSEGVAAFNQMGVERQCFRFRIKTYATPDSLIKRTDPGLVTLVIERVDTGERLQHLRNSSSAVTKVLSSGDLKDTWVHFLVDKQSVDVFRFLRSIAQEQGALIGWEPVEVKFPMEEPLTAVEGGQDFDLIRGFQQTR